MGCNCKKAKRIEKKFPEFSKKVIDKKGIKRFFQIFKEFFNKLLGTCFIFIVSCILLPIIICLLIFSFLTKGQLTIPLPNIKKISQKIKN